jgi:E3 ubiquitin-protein ligase makorin
MTEPCRFFAQGSCAFGSACRFAHVGPKDKAAPPRKAPAVPVSQEQKIDPYDESRLTFAQLEEKYAGQYDEQELKEYWRYDMLPLIGEQLAPIVAKADRGQREVCRFFLSGGCTFGDACRNLHVIDVADLDEDAPKTLEPQARPPEALGEAAGPSPLTHGPRKTEGYCDPQELAALPLGPWPSAASRSRRPGPAAAGAIGQGRKAPAEVDDAECVICTESIKKRGERFGMLESCDHAFCLSCIRAWRKQREHQDKANLRMCPVCRKQSFFVIPCDRLITDPSEKERTIEAYKHQMSEVPCKAFDYGRGKCPLGTSCFYAHLNPDGSRYIAQPRRKMEGANGSLVVGEVKLSDFFE